MPNTTGWKSTSKSQPAPARKWTSIQATTTNTSFIDERHDAAAGAAAITLECKKQKLPADGHILTRTYVMRENKDGKYVRVHQSPIVTVRSSEFAVERIGRVTPGDRIRIEINPSHPVTVDYVGGETLYWK